jgi:hypothetical protein
MMVVGPLAGIAFFIRSYGPNWSFDLEGNWPGALIILFIAEASGGGLYLLTKIDARLEEIQNSLNRGA